MARGHGFISILPECEVPGTGEGNSTGGAQAAEAKARGAVETFNVDSLSAKLWHLWLTSNVGPLRLPHALYNSYNLAGGLGTNTAIQVAVNRGNHALFVRMTNPAGGGAVTFFASSAGGLSIQSCAQVNMGVAPFFDAILFPGDVLWAQNQAGAAYVITVATVDIPFRSDLW